MAAENVVDEQVLAPPAEEPMEVDPNTEVGEDLVTISADGGVVKKILVAGQGSDTPEIGSEVFVHYVGTLEDGSKFDSSRDRGEPFSFRLGEGRVIKGWDLGVATMKRGEKCVLTCKADYAYGASGSPPKIPPGATLNFEVELLSWKSDNDLTDDGGVMRTVVTQGTGWAKPDDRDEVTVVYSISVAGEASPVVSTPPEGVEFTLGSEAGAPPGLIPAIPLAVKTMKKGEAVKLVVQPQYGYGEAGYEGVPPGASLQVELSLVSWKTVQDVTPDGGVVKKTLLESSEWKTPNEGAQVTVRLVGRLADGTVFESHPEGQELQFITDSEAVPEGVDLAVQRMKKGEKALVTLQPEYGYGSTGRPAGGAGGAVAAVPGGAVLQYEIELVELINAKDTWEMDESEKVEAARAKKEKANKAYREGKIQRAIKLYDRTVLMVADDKTMSETAKRQAREVRSAVQLNLSAAHLKLNNWKDAAVQAGKVLEHDPANVKALYRRAQALIGQGDYVEAEIDVKRGLVEQADNADLAALHRKLKSLMKEQAKKEAALYSKMFRPVAADAGKGEADSAPVSDQTAAVEAAPQPEVAA